MKYFQVILFLVITHWVIAQSTTPNGDSVTLPSKILHGRLDNGLTYYLAKTQGSTKEIHVTLVEKAGYFTDQPGELGVAHLIEHLGFRSTLNFPDGLRHSMVGLGLQPGKNINGSTHFTTDYYLTIPSGDSVTLEKSLLCLLDWAGGRVFQQREIDEERAAVVNELTRANTRLFLSWLKERPYLCLDQNPLYKPSLAEETEAIEHVSEETIRQYEKRMYHPDLQGVIITGDIDEKYVLNRLTVLFSNRQRSPGLELSSRDIISRYDVPLTGRNKLVIVNHGPETPSIKLEMYKKRKSITGIDGPTNSNEVRSILCDDLYNELIKKRLEKINSMAQSSNLRLSSMINRRVLNPLAGIDALTIHFEVDRIEEIKTFLQQSVMELHSVSRWGFSIEEFRSAKIDVARQISRRNILSDARLLNVGLRSHFSFGTLLRDSERELKILNEISVAELNEATKKWIEEDGNTDVVLSTSNDQDPRIPDEGELFSWISDAMRKVPARYIHRDIDSLSLPYLKSAPYRLTTPVDNKSNMVVLTLANGINVYVKQLGLPGDARSKRNQIVVQAFRQGGLDSFNKSDYKSASLAPSLVEKSGIGSMNHDAFREWLAEHNKHKQLVVYPYIRATSAGIFGGATISNSENMFRLLYLYFTQPKFDKSEFAKLTAKRNRSRFSMFNDTVTAVASGIVYSPDRLKSNSPHLSESRRIYKEMFANAHNFDFVVAGYFDMTSVADFSAKYIGNLPGTPVTRPTMTKKGNGTSSRPPGESPRVSMIGDSTGNVRVRILFQCSDVINGTDQLKLEILNQIIRAKLFERLRTKDKFVYDISSSLTHGANPGKYSIDVDFETLPDTVDQAIASIVDEISNISLNGVDPKTFHNAVNTVRDELIGRLHSATYWADYLTSKIIQGSDIDDPSLELSFLNSVTTSDIYDACKELIRTEHYALFKLF